MSESVRKALKEWAVAVKALERGEQVILLRKGGIVEGPGGFKLESDRFFLFPTYFHQDAEVLKDEYRGWVEEVFHQRPPGGRVRIGLFAEVHDVVPVTELSGVTALSDTHIWSASYIADRFDWKPESPLFVLVLRVFRLLSASEIDLRPAYGGCTSWVDLETEITTTRMEPVLDEEAFISKRNFIKNALFREDTKQSLPRT